MDMKKWIQDMADGGNRKGFPLVSSPAATLLGVSLLEMIHSPSLAAKGIIEIASRTDAAAAVSMMDLSVEAEAFGAEIRYSENEIPTVTAPLLASVEEALEMKVPRVGEGRTGGCLETVTLARGHVGDRPLLAGVIGPFSLAGRLLGISELMVCCYTDPDEVRVLLDKVSDFCSEYILAFREAGADGVIIAEPLTGMLSPALAAEFSAPYVRRVISAAQNDTFAVIYHNCGNNTPKMTDSIASVGAAAYHFGNAVDLEDLLRQMPSDRPIMGNLDPAGVLLRGTPEDVKEATLSMMRRLCPGHANYVASSGCDMPPATPWENVEAFIAAVNEYYAG